MNKLIRKLSLVCTFIALFSAVAIHAEELGICEDSSTVLAYFNGVMTVEGEALLNLKKMMEFLDVEEDYDINRELFYNHSNGLRDFAEVFEQRMYEHHDVLSDRFELFFSALKGKGKWWNNIIEVMPSTAEVMLGIYDTVEAYKIGFLASLLDSTPKLEDYRDHQVRIDNWHNEGKKLLFVAHSQGNLFANNAYKYALGKGRTASSTKVVHIAPASPTTNGPHVLADKDVVIKALSLVGGVPSVTDVIPSYSERLPGLNDETDSLGHGLLEIYLNPNLDISAVIKSHIRNALDTLEKPSNQKFDSGFLTATLTWNGSGDVDLHAYEPSGSHVYYANRRGVSGILDVDNTSSYGPEHYVISCEKSSITTGVYSIKVANYSRADGRVATVQLATAQDGVLDTKEIPLGSPTGSNPVYEAFQVEVSQDPETQRYSTNLIN